MSDHYSISDNGRSASHSYYTENCPLSHESSADCHYCPSGSTLTRYTSPFNELPLTPSRDPWTSGYEVHDLQIESIQFPGLQPGSQPYEGSGDILRNASVEYSSQLPPNMRPWPTRSDPPYTPGLAEGILESPFPAAANCETHTGTTSKTRRQIAQPCDLLVQQGQTTVYAVDEFDPIAGKFRCADCLSTFGRRAEMLRHRDQQHDGKQRSFECRTCLQAFYWHKDLVRHMGVHLPKANYSCDRPGCEQSKPFSRKDNFKRHLKIKHGPHPVFCRAKRGCRKWTCDGTSQEDMDKEHEQDLH